MKIKVEDTIGLQFDDLKVLVDLQIDIKMTLLKSGDSWTVEQEVVGSNPTHGGNLISVVRSLSGFTEHIR